MNITVWKFDVMPRAQGEMARRFTCYIKHATRGECFRALFALYRKAKIFGTGTPLTAGFAEAEIGRALAPGEVLLLDNLS